MLAVCRGARCAAQSHSAMRRPSLRRCSDQPCTSTRSRRPSRAIIFRSTRALPPFPPAHGYHQSNPRFSPRTRFHSTARSSALVQGAARGLNLTPEAFSPHLVHLIAELDEDWRRLDPNPNRRGVNPCVPTSCPPLGLDNNFIYSHVLACRPELCRYAHVSCARRRMP